MLLRTWNVFHGNAVPRDRRGYLEQMVRLASEDRPDVLFLQEVPAWALPRLAGWSGMTTAAADIAARPPLGTRLGHWVTRIDSTRLRAGFAGQGNAILVAQHFQAQEGRLRVLNPWPLRRRLARRLRLGVASRARWASERRICQSVRVRTNDRELLLANLHISNHPDGRIRDAELERAFEFVGDDAGTVVLGGDFNRDPGSSPVFQGLIERGRFSPGGIGIDHVLVRGGGTVAEARWADEHRTLDGRLLSDHAPVEVLVDL